MIGDELKNYTWQNIMNMCLEQVADDVDKREGSIIYDALSPAVTALMVEVEQKRNVYKNTFLGTANGEYLDMRVKELGLTRIPATQAIRRVYIYDKDGNLMDLELGTLITPKGDGTLLFSLYEKEGVGTYKALCGEKGTIGNEYIGECEAISNLTTIGSITMTDLIKSARNEENDEELRARAIDSIDAKTFGGNIADYRRLVGTELSNVGQMQVYPRDTEDEIIVLSVVDSENKPMNAEQLSAIKEKLSPTNFDSEGRGIIPIGHKVVVVSPTEKSIDFSMTVVPKTGYTKESLQSPIQDKLGEYINEVAKEWSNISYENTDLYSVSIITSQIVGIVANIEGVLSVEDVKINGEIVNKYLLIENKEKQEIPKIGNIIVN